MIHHAHLGDQTVDPDYLRYKQLGLHALPHERSRFYLILLRMIFLIDIPKYIWGTLSAVVYTRGIPVREWIARGVLMVTAILLITCMSQWKNVALFWIIPFLTSFQIIRFLAELSEHGGLYHKNKNEEMTRNNICHCCLAWLLYPHGDSHHLVHHLHPAIPYYNLKRAHEVLLKDVEYQRLHHCYGIIYNKIQGVKSTYAEMFGVNDQYIIPGEVQKGML